MRDAWVAPRLSVCLQLRAWSQDGSRVGLPAASLLLPLPVSLSLSLCVSHEQINKSLKKRREGKEITEEVDENYNLGLPG